MYRPRDTNEKGVGMIKYDLSKANAVIDEYVKAIQGPGVRRFNRVWLEFCMERNGLIPNVRHLHFGESHALWYACLVHTGRVREVSRLEVKTNCCRPGVTTDKTIKKCLSAKWSTTRDTLSARLLREILAKA